MNSNLSTSFALLLALIASIFYVHAVINVHLVQHTHDDVGWLKTIDQYYYGANNSIQHAGVQYILDSVIPSLQANPERKFIYVEQAFFERWWNQQTTDMQNTVRGLIQNGQLEFVGGGVCMHDEAATHYIDMIDQTTHGHKFLMDTFGVVPRIGWQIDPFGHSSTQAALLSGEVGFDALFFGRIDYQDHDLRSKTKTLEFVWQASPSLNANESAVFSSVASSGNYGPPDGFCFDLFCSDDPIKDDKRLYDYNVDSKIQLFFEAVKREHDNHQGENIMFQMGSDFMYENANLWYKNLDKLIKYANERSNGTINVFYSTPSQYIKARHAENIQWPSKTDDFFPYADGEHQFWTGYFTSRPALKRHVRVASSLLNSIRQIEALTGGDGSATHKLSAASGVLQHHDGVSGTSKQHVAYDYALRLADGSVDALAFASTALNNITLMEGESKTNAKLDYQVCLLTNVSICSLSQRSSSFTLLIYNPLVRARSELIRVPINADSASVRDSAGNSVLSQIVPVMNSTAITAESSSHTLFFAAHIPPLGYSTYTIITTYHSLLKNNKEKQQYNAVYTEPKFIEKNYANPVIIQNAKTRLTFDTTTGLLTTMEDIRNGLSIKASQEFFYYRSYVRDNDQNSGAYIFRPASNDAIPVTTGSASLSVIDGPLVKEVRQVFSNWISQIVRLNSVTMELSEAAEFEWTVGSIPIDDNWGKEVITRFTTDIQSSGALYTDSNGRETLKRVRDFRPTWPLKQTEPVAGNYYPINSLASIQDEKTSLNIIPDRAEGAASIIDGQLEIMLHRRTLADDSRGVGEPLNETDAITPYPEAKRIGKGLIITGIHKVFIAPPKSAAAIYRPLAHRVTSPIQAFFAASSNTNGNNNYFSNHYGKGSATTFELPSNIELLTLSAQSSGTWLVRLVHIFAVGEDSKLSAPVTIDMAGLFSGFGWKIQSMEERSLTGNQKYDGMKRLSFRSDINPAAPDIDTRQTTVQGTSILIAPMQIKTLLVKAVKAMVQQE